MKSEHFKNFHRIQGCPLVDKKRKPKEELPSNLPLKKFKKDTDKSLKSNEQATETVNKPIEDNMKGKKLKKESIQMKELENKVHSVGSKVLKSNISANINKSPNRSTSLQIDVRKGFLRQAKKVTALGKITKQVNRRKVIENIGMETQTSENTKAENVDISSIKVETTAMKDHEEIVQGESSVVVKEELKTEEAGNEDGMEVTDSKSETEEDEDSTDLDEEKKIFRETERALRSLSGEWDGFDFSADDKDKKSSKRGSRSKSKKLKSEEPEPENVEEKIEELQDEIKELHEEVTKENDDNLDDELTDLSLSVCSGIKEVVVENVVEIEVSKIIVKTETENDGEVENITDVVVTNNETVVGEGNDDDDDDVENLLRIEQQCASIQSIVARQSQDDPIVKEEEIVASEPAIKVEVKVEVKSEATEDVPCEVEPLREGSIFPEENLVFEVAMEEVACSTVEQLSEISSVVPEAEETVELCEEQVEKATVIEETIVESQPHDWPTVGLNEEIDDNIASERHPPESEFKDQQETEPMLKESEVSDVVQLGTDSTVATELALENKAISYTHETANESQDVRLVIVSPDSVKSEEESKQLSPDEAHCSDQEELVHQEEVVDEKEVAINESLGDSVVPLTPTIDGGQPVPILLKDVNNLADAKSKQTTPIFSAPMVVHVSLAQALQQHPQFASSVQFQQLHQSLQHYQLPSTSIQHIQLTNNSPQSLVIAPQQLTISPQQLNVSPQQLNVSPQQLAALSPQQLTILPQQLSASLQQLGITPQQLQQLKVSPHHQQLIVSQLSQHLAIVSAPQQQQQQQQHLTTSSPPKQPGLALAAHQMPRIVSAPLQLGIRPTALQQQQLGNGLASALQQHVAAAVSASAQQLGLAPTQDQLRLVASSQQRQQLPSAALLQQQHQLQQQASSSQQQVRLSSALAQFVLPSSMAQQQLKIVTSSQMQLQQQQHLRMVATQQNQIGSSTAVQQLLRQMQLSFNQQQAATSQQQQHQLQQLNNKSSFRLFKRLSLPSSPRLSSHHPSSDRSRLSSRPRSNHNLSRMNKHQLFQCYLQKTLQ